MSADTQKLASEYALDKEDKEILDIVQSAFPITSRPYADIGKIVDLDEEEVFKRVQKMKELKLIRRLGANFQSSKLGFRSTLCAAKVPDDKMEEFVNTVNAITGATHNYLRKHTFNIWFTLIASSWEKVEETLQGITDKTGVAILNLPATKLYKIKVDFKTSEN